MKPTIKDRPKYVHHLMDVLREEMFSFKELVKNEWYWSLATVLAVVTVVVLLDPLPKTTLRVAAGQPNSGLHVMAKKYAAFLEDHGIAVQYVHSNGAPDNLKLINEGAADFGFSQSGLAAPPGVNYMGSIAYQPLWLFYVGEPPAERDLIKYLTGKRVSIGAPNSGSEMMSGQLLNTLTPEVLSMITRLPMNNADTIKALKSHEIDAAFLLASFESGNVKAMFDIPNVGMFDFQHSHGLATRMGFPVQVMLPAGSLGLAPVKPQQDIRMIAATMTLIGHKDLHPATQKLLMAASQSIASRSEDWFARAPGYTPLPAFVDKSLARSKVAERYFEQGPSPVFGHLPYWLANLVDSLWVIVLALVAVAYPLLKAIPRHRNFMFEAMVEHRFQRIKGLEQRAQAQPTGEALQQCLLDVRSLINDVNNLWVPTGCENEYFMLITRLHQIQSDLLWQAHGGSLPILTTNTPQSDTATA